MMLIRLIPYYLVCICSGVGIAGGYVAFITLLGVFEKLSEKLKTNKHSFLLENLIILGVLSGNLLSLFKWKLCLGSTAFFIFTFFGGVFIGCLAGALSETLNIFPIISRRLNIRSWLPYILIAGAIGKTIGSIIHLILFK